MQSKKSNNIWYEKFNLIFLKTNIINNPEEVSLLIPKTNWNFAFFSCADEKTRRGDKSFIACVCSGSRIYKIHHYKTSHQLFLTFLIMSWTHPYFIHSLSNKKKLWVFFVLHSNSTSACILHYNNVYTLNVNRKTVVLLSCLNLQHVHIYILQW